MGTKLAFADGRYVVEHAIGEGARKVVYAATDARLERRVAVACIKPEVLDERSRERVLDETRAMARLDPHPHVVTLHDFGDEDGAPFIVAEYLGGGTVASKLEAAGGRLPLAEALTFAEQVAHGLAHAHASGVAHLDVKPSNVCLTVDNQAKLTDFGLAFLLDRSRRTLSGEVIGTAAYLAPELARGDEPTFAADLYSLGAMLYEMLTGTPPFVGDSPVAVAAQHLHATPVAPSWHDPSVPRAIEAVVLKLLAKRTGDRATSAASLAEELAALAAVTRGAPAATAATDVNPLRRTVSRSFIGRSQELEQLQAAFERSVAGTGSVALIAGEPGIGKTRLSQELGAYAGLRGAQAMTGRCFEGGGAPPLWPWVQLLRACVRDRSPEEIVAAVGNHTPELAQLIPEAAVTDGPPVSADDEQARFRLFDAVASFLVELGRQRPLLLVIDDLHWADPLSLRLLAFLAHEVDRARVFVVGTYRPSESDTAGRLADTIAEVRREPGTEVLTLGGLDRGDVCALIEQRAGTEASDEFAAAVLRDTSGNPFFVEEVLRHLIEEAGDDAPLRATSATILSVPAGVREVIARRVKRLSPETAATLSSAAVVGREFDLTLLVCVVMRDRADVLRNLDEAVNAYLIESVEDRAHGFRFSHALVREALYDALGSSERASAHTAIGEAIETVYAEELDAFLPALAHHFAQSAGTGELDRAFRYARAAGTQAHARLAYEDAAEHFGAARSMAASLALVEGERALLAIEYGDAAFRAGKRDAARVAFLDAIDLARPLVASGYGDGPRLLGRAAFGLGDIWGVAGRVDADVVRVLEEAVDAQSGDSVLHARLLARLAVGYYWGGDAERRTELSRSAREMAHRLGDQQTLAYVLDAAHYALWSPDNVHERLELANEIAEIGGGGAEVTGSAAGVFWRIIDALELGDLPSVDRDIQTYSRVSEETRQPHYRWYAAVTRAMRAMLAGRLDEGEALALEAFSIGAEPQGENATHFLGVQMLELARLRGDFTPIEGPVEEFVARFPAIPAWRATLAYVRACQGDLEAARRQLRVLAEADLRKIPRDTAYLVAGALVAEACHRLDEKDLAAIVYEMLEPFADHNVVVGNAAACMGSVSYYLGLLAHTLGHTDAARGHYANALRMHEALDSPPYVALTRAASAALAIESGDDQSAETLIEQATAEAKLIGMGLLERRAAEITSAIRDARAARAAAPADEQVDRGEAPAEGPRGTPSPDAHLFRREGEYWTLAFAGSPVRVRQSRGLEYLSVLLAAPHREVHALELVQSVSSAGADGAVARPAAELARTESAQVDADSDAGEMLDERAIAEYRERLADLEAELAEAESFNDSGRQQTLGAEIEFLKAEVARAVGLGGRRRKAGSAAERARVSVTRAIKTALSRVADAEPQLGRHLRTTVKTGTFCSYTPDPRAPVDWQL